MNNSPEGAQGSANSKTPRTDNAYHAAFANNSFRVDHFADFARQLERQLAAVEKERDAYHKKACEIADQRDRAEKERDEAREQWRMSSVCRELQAKLTAAESELAALRKDRERLLDHLRGIREYAQAGSDLYLMADCDSAIDAARQQEGKPGQP